MDCADHLKIYAEFVPKKPGDKQPSERKQEKEKEKEKEGEKPQVALPNGGNFDYNSIKTVAASGKMCIRDSPGGALHLRLLRHGRKSLEKKDQQGQQLYLHVFKTGRAVFSQTTLNDFHSIKLCHHFRIFKDQT